MDWNQLQEDWQSYKRKVRGRAFYHSFEDSNDEVDVNLTNAKSLEPPRVKSSREPATAKIPAIEVFLNSVEKDLFDIANVRKVQDNLTFEERQAMKEFRSTPTDERDLVIRLQDKSHSFVFLDNALDSDKVKEQMDKGSFKVLEYDISESTCIDIQNWLEKWKNGLCQMNG